MVGGWVVLVTIGGSNGCEYDCCGCGCGSSCGWCGCMAIMCWSDSLDVGNMGSNVVDDDSGPMDSFND